MATIDGVWESKASSPIGPQTSTMTLRSTGAEAFEGSSTSPMGTVEIRDGRVSGDRVTFAMKVTMPFPMTMKAEGTLAGDTLTGDIDTGAFGKMSFTATRQG